MPFFVILGALALLGAGAVVASEVSTARRAGKRLGVVAAIGQIWTKAREAVAAWASRNGHKRIFRVVLRIDSIVNAAGRTLRRLRILAQPKGAKRSRVIEERVIRLKDLPEHLREELRTRKTVRKDLTKQVLEN